MKREAFIRELRVVAKRNNVFFDVVPEAGKGSHYRVYYGKKSTIVKSGELSPLYVKLVKKQLCV